MLDAKAKEIVNGIDDKMQEAVMFLEEDLKTYRLGKANPSVFNSVVANYYGTPTPIPQMASISAPDAKTLAIQPWDKSMIKIIERPSSTPTWASPRRTTAKSSAAPCPPSPRKGAKTW